MRPISDEGFDCVLATTGNMPEGFIKRAVHVPVRCHPEWMISFADRCYLLFKAGLKVLDVFFIKTIAAGPQLKIRGYWCQAYVPVESLVHHIPIEM